jgi:hypothetical protein
METGEETADSAENSNRLQNVFPLLSEEEQLFILGQAERIKAAQNMRENPWEMLSVGQNYTKVGRGQ